MRRRLGDINIIGFRHIKTMKQGIARAQLAPRPIMQIIDIIIQRYAFHREGKMVGFYYEAI